MKNQPTPTVAHSDLTGVTDGIVIGLEIGSWAGFHSGRITIMSENKNRIDFRYGKDSDGIIPKIGDFVRVVYTGENVHEISTIRIIEANHETFSQRLPTKSSSISLIFGRPKGAFAIIVSEVFAGFYLIQMGLLMGLTRPAAPAIYGTVGFVQLVLAWLIWEYTSRG
jgi:hypothetical protein